MTAARAQPQFSVCVVVPFYNHERAIAATVAAIRPHGLRCIVVDDGSDARCTPVLEQIAAQERGWLQVHRQAVNGGKGAAVMCGFERAAAAGHTHALQIDADGQHSFADIPRLLAAAQAQPGAVISAIPRYDASVPKVRYYGRMLTHALVWLETLSFEIRDSMIGFRLYPLAPTLALCRRARIGTRMDFDTDILVRLHWEGLRVVSLPTPVTYPSDGVSHFRYVRDNLRMTSLHVRLLLGMLVRAPRLLWRRLRR